LIECEKSVFAGAAAFSSRFALTGQLLWPNKQGKSGIVVVRPAAPPLLSCAEKLVRNEARRILFSSSSLLRLSLQLGLVYIFRFLSSLLLLGSCESKREKEKQNSRKFAATAVAVKLKPSKQQIVFSLSFLSLLFVLTTLQKVIL
jgi:hypothetical protein